MNTCHLQTPTEQKLPEDHNIPKEENCASSSSKVTAGTETGVQTSTRQRTRWEAIRGLNKGGDINAVLQWPWTREKVTTDSHISGRVPPQISTTLEGTEYKHSHQDRRGRHGRTHNFFEGGSFSRKCGPSLEKFHECQVPLDSPLRIRLQLYSRKQEQFWYNTLHGLKSIIYKLFAWKFEWKLKGDLTSKK